MDKLLPCPFCGGDAHSTPFSSKHAYTVIRCNKCSAVGPMHLKPEALIEAWNTRQGIVVPVSEKGCCMSCKNWRYTQDGRGECGRLKTYTDEGFYCSHYFKPAASKDSHG